MANQLERSKSRPQLGLAAGFPKRQAVQFLENEIKTYTALAIFLSKEGIKTRVQVGDKKVVTGPTYYKEKDKGGQENWSTNSESRAGARPAENSA
jgi:hypothetical protein